MRTAKSHGHTKALCGSIIASSAERLAGDPDVREFYLGMGGGGEAKSFKDIKHYKRRKRWLS